MLVLIAAIYVFIEPENVVDVSQYNWEQFDSTFENYPWMIYAPFSLMKIILLLLYT